MWSERDLVGRLQTGDRRSLEAFVDAFGPRVHRLVARNLASRTDAEDVTQEVFVAIFKGLPGFRGESSLETWVYRIAMNHCLMYRRKAASTPLTVADADLDREPASAPGPAEHAEAEDLRTRVNSAVSQLPDGQRDVVVLHELHGLTYQECAQALDIPVGTVKSRLSNAFRTLRHSLAAYANEEAFASPTALEVAP